MQVRWPRQGVEQRDALPSCAVHAAPRCRRRNEIMLYESIAVIVLAGLWATVSLLLRHWDRIEGYDQHPPQGGQQVGGGGWEAAGRGEEGGQEKRGACGFQGKGKEELGPGRPLLGWDGRSAETQRGSAAGRRPQTSS